jgi:MraZ protein
MSSFKGSYNYSVDDKGRINIPAKLRKFLSTDANETFVITRGYERCLFVYPFDEWERLERAIRELSTTDRQNRFFTRTLLEKATDSALDGQSRITVPRELLQYAGIENDVLILGVLERIELWNPAVYEQYRATQEEPYEAVAQRVLRK